MQELTIGQSGETIENSTYILLKTEKLSTAVHLVTAHLSQREPIREELRRISLLLVDTVRTLATNGPREQMSDTRNLASVADALLSVLSISRGAKIISETNAQVLESEYQELKNYFEHNYLDDTILPEKRPSQKREKSIGHAKGHDSKRVKKVDLRPTSTATVSSGHSRTERILNIIEEEKGDYSLSEISAKISGVSEKTIQRDLLKLVSGKVLKRTGERRWSRYSLA